jgi:hypothetical protein
VSDDAISAFRPSELRPRARVRPVSPGNSMIKGRQIMMMNRRTFSAGLLAGSAASLVSPDEIAQLILEAAGQSS